MEKTSATVLGKGQGLKSWGSQEQVWLERGITYVPVQQLFTEALYVLA